MLELTDSEKLAFRMVTSIPEAAKSIANPDGGIEIKALHAFMKNLVSKLELSDVKRRKTFIEVEKL